MAVLLSLSLLGPVLPTSWIVSARADGGSGPEASYGPPPALPPGSFEDDAESPRRDIHMGTVDHMRMGRDDDGNVTMEIRPRPKKVEDQPQVGPFYIYPQIGGRSMPMGGQPGQSGPPGPPGQPPGRHPSAPGQGQAGPWPGQPVQPGQPGQFGQSAQPAPAGQPGPWSSPGQGGVGQPSPQGQWNSQGQGLPASGQAPQGQQGAGF